MKPALDRMTIGPRLPDRDVADVLAGACEIGHDAAPLREHT